LNKDKEDPNEIKEEFINRLRTSLKENTFVKLTLGKFRGQGDESLENIYVAPVKLKGEIVYSFRWKYKTRDIFKNFTIDETAAEIENEIGKNFLYAGLFSTDGDFILEYNKRRIPRTYSRKASFSRVDIKEHNRIKTRFLDSKAEYLNLLGITNLKGEVRGEKYDKFRQIDKFIEIVDSLVRDSPLAEKDKISIVDFGSGKSYLTFAVYDYFRYHLNIDVKVTGVEQRADLAASSNEISEKCGFKGLSFTAGEIADFKAGNTDIVTALHACDTATDDAIAKAFKMNAAIIILAPCCQKYVRKQIHIPEDLTPVFKHGILEEHLSSFITDGLRSLALESQGYSAKIFEFISHEHTSKNLMITAVKHEIDDQTPIAKFVEIEKLKSRFGLKDFYLDTIVNLSPEK
jgi:hypothetical protein